MHFIIINELEGFSRDICAHFSRKQSCVITSHAFAGGKEIYLLHLPITPYPQDFSIIEDSLYWGKQWIGTISKQKCLIQPGEETCVYLNEDAEEVLYQYIESLLLAPVVSSVHELEKKASPPAASGFFMHTTEEENHSKKRRTSKQHEYFLGNIPK